MTLNVGDIITIGKSTKRSRHFLVVRSEHLCDDPGDGVPYTVDEIDVVPTGWNNDTIFDPSIRTVIHEGGQLSNDDLRSFYFTDGSMRGKGKPIQKSDVKVVGTCKLKAEVHITYTLSKTKYFCSRKSWACS
jgi:hypothetical protein